MAVGRLGGDRLVHRVGPTAVVRGSATLAAVGLGAGLLIGQPWAGIATANPATRPRLPE